MAITPGTWGRASSGAPITLAVTNPADSGARMFEARVVAEVRGTEPTSITVTYGGVTATQVTGSPAGNPTGAVARVYSFYILDADLPAAGAQDAVMAITGGADVSFQLFATVHDGVTQAAPGYFEAGIDPVETALTIGSISYADGDYASLAAVNSDAFSTFTWSGSWTERLDAADFSGDARAGLADRTYSGTGTDSVTATISAGTRIAGAVLVWSAASASTSALPKILQQLLNFRRRH